MGQASALVADLHRNHKPPLGHRFSIGCVLGRSLVGVAMCGRPVARALDDGWTLEVSRVATDGTPNACSKLYGAAWRAARALGYQRLVTYTLPSGGGASLRAAGFDLDGTTRGRPWVRSDGAPRANENTEDKSRWIKVIGALDYDPRDLAWDRPTPDPRQGVLFG